MPKKDDAFPKADESVATSGPRTERQKKEDYARLLGLDVGSGASEAEIDQQIRQHLGTAQEVGPAHIERR